MQSARSEYLHMHVMLSDVCVYRYHMSTMLDHLFVRYVYGLHAMYMILWVKSQHQGFV